MCDGSNKKEALLRPLRHQCCCSWVSDTWRARTVALQKHGVFVAVGTQRDHTAAHSRAASHPRRAVPLDCQVSPVFVPGGHSLDSAARHNNVNYTTTYLWISG